MFVNKVQEQKAELLHAVFRNMYRKEKLDYLDNECKILAQHIIDSQVTRAENDERILTLKNELNNLKQLHESAVQELALSTDKITSMSAVLAKTHSPDAFKAIDQDLNVKDHQLKCLQHELIELRLREAENWALIRDLRDTKRDLDRDKEMLLTTKPETIARLQDEYISIKLLENQYKSEFDAIKQHLATLKQQVEHYKKDHQQKAKPEGKVKLTIKGATWRSTDKDKDNRETINTKELDEEKIYLQNKVPELQNKIENLNRHADLKQEESCKLRVALDEVRTKQQSLEQLTLDRKRQYAYLENSANEKVFDIRTSCDGKRQDIEHLSNKLDEASNRRQSDLFDCEASELRAVQALEGQVVALQAKIEQLNSEVKNLQCLI